MKRKRFSVEEIFAVLQPAEQGMKVADPVRHVGISEQTFYRWKTRYSGLQSDQVRELNQRQDENTRLVADLGLDKAILQDINRNKWPGPPTGCTQRAFHSGARFSANALGPSWKSSDVWALMFSAFFSCAT